MERTESGQKNAWQMQKHVIQRKFMEVSAYTAACCLVLVYVISNNPQSRAGSGQYMLVIAYDRNVESLGLVVRNLKG